MPVSTQTQALPDPFAEAARLITTEAPDGKALERRLKADTLASIERIKPGTTTGVDFENDVMTGDYFAALSAPLQGIAIARIEGSLAFYQRVGWHRDFLDAPLDTCVPDTATSTLTTRYHARSLHDLAYIHPRDFVKMLGKEGAATLWDTLQQYSRNRP